MYAVCRKRLSIRTPRPFRVSERQAFEVGVCGWAEPRAATERVVDSKISSGRERPATWFVPACTDFRPARSVAAVPDLAGWPA
jgi:hypothetical protein